MSDSELERLLTQSLDAVARAQVDDAAVPPHPRFADSTAAPARSPRWNPRLFAPVAAAAAVIAVVSLILAITRTTTGQGTLAGTAHPSSTHAPSTPPSVAPDHAVHVQFAASPTTDVGVGLPVVAYFSHRITNGRQWASATHVSVDGRPTAAAWYFEVGTPSSGHVMEAHLRPRGFWPPHADISVSVDGQGLSAGGGLTFGSNLHTSFTTGPRRVAVVDNATHRLTVVSDGRQVATFPVSLGTAATPTSSGIKVIMQKRRSMCMNDSVGTYYECGIKYDQRLTYDGEYLHAAPWNTANIEQGVNTSNGCTQLTTANARALYRLLNVGDVVEYPNATGPKMQLGAGYGDWNVSWRQWRTGGAVPTG